jgi:hypothetical protein
MDFNGKHVSGNGELYAMTTPQFPAYLAKGKVGVEEPLIVPFVVSGLDVDVHAPSGAWIRRQWVRTILP